MSETETTKKPVTNVVHAKNVILKALREGDEKVFSGMSPSKVALEFLRDMQTLVKRIEEGEKL